MLKVIEFIDIEKIEEIRYRCLNSGLDDYDNFSYHIALVEGGTIFGIARLYKVNQDIILDNLALEKFAKDSHREMLFRALLLKSIDLSCEYVKAKAEYENDFYKKFNFDDDFKVKPKDIIFPKICKICENKNKTCCGDKI